MKLKLCSGCNSEKVIWKNHEGNKYCKDCWMKQSYKETPPAKNYNRIKPISDKKRVEDILYTKLRKDFLEKPENSTCKAKLSGCMGVFKQNLTIHHTKGRGRYYLDSSTWIPLCLSCHEWVETHPKEAREMGLSGSKIID